MFDFEILLDKIRNGEPFSYARYGDGEWNAILGKQGRNCDGHEYYPEMGLELKKVLESKPEYYLGCQTLGKEQNEGNPEFDRLYAINTWTENEVLHRASIHGRMDEFFKVLENKNVVLVGNRSLEKLPITCYFIEIPEKNCWLKFDEVLVSLKQTVRPGDIVLYSASMMTEILIDRMKDHSIIQLDCGSVFDPYINKNSRSYHQKIINRING